MNRSTLIVSLGGLLFAYLALFVGSAAEAKRKVVEKDCDHDEAEAPEPPEAAKPPEAPEAPEPADFDFDVDFDDGDEAEKMNDDDDDDDEADDEDEDRSRRGRGQGTGSQTQKVAVKGPIEFSVDIMSGDVHVTASNKNEVVVTADSCNVQLHVSGDQVEADLDGGRGPCTGDVTITVPSKSRVKIESIDGEIVLTGSYGDVDIESVNGGVQIEKAVNVEVEAVNGDITVGTASGSAHIETVEGNVKIKQSAAAPVMHFESVNGNLEWTGLCGKGCRIDAEAFQGDIRLKLDTKSSFELKFNTHSGSWDDQLGLTTIDKSASKKKRSKALKATYGAGGGQIRAATYSGDLQVGKK